MKPSEMPLKLVDIQSVQYAASNLDNSLQEIHRKKRQRRFFYELRILKTASKLTLEQNDFACQLVSGLQKGEIAVLSMLLADSSLPFDSLQIAVAGAQRVLDTFDLVARLEVDQAQVRLWLQHRELGNVCVGIGDSQFDCVDSAQDITLRSIAERVNDFFVMR
ncbi:MAG: hypothetical protein Q8T09_01020 [Candidatus Melainabacteria bacterium]|nr:hypothetical protein [Candidatus Melainabacteria bacterium]